MSRKAVPIVLTGEEKRALESLANSRTAPYRKVQRARLVLLAAEGMASTAIAQEVGLQRSMVVKWRQRFIGERIAGLEDRPRPGKPRQYSDADRLRVIMHPKACCRDTLERANSSQSYGGRTRHSTSNFAQGESKATSGRYFLPVH